MFVRHSPGLGNPPQGGSRDRIRASPTRSVTFHCRMKDRFGLSRRTELILYLLIRRCELWFLRNPQNLNPSRVPSICPPDPVFSGIACCMCCSRCWHFPLRSPYVPEGIGRASSHGLQPPGSDAIVHYSFGNSSD